MTLVDQILFGMDVVSLLLIFAAVKFMVRNREYELLEIEKSYNSILFGLFFMLLITLANLIIIAPKIFLGLSAYINFGAYTPLVESINGIALTPIFAVCVLVGMLLARDYLVKYPKKKEEKEDKKGKK